MVESDNVCPICRNPTGSLALRVEKATSLKPVIRRPYVLDTNVLLHGPVAITAFKQHHLVIPMLANAC